LSGWTAAVKGGRIAASRRTQHSAAAAIDSSCRRGNVGPRPELMLKEERENVFRRDERVLRLKGNVPYILCGTPPPRRRALRDVMTPVLYSPPDPVSPVSIPRLLPLTMERRGSRGRRARGSAGAFTAQT